MQLQPMIDNSAHITQSSNRQFAVLASQYSYEELTDIYNKTRIDYIVPMPMNVRRMKEYVTSYDVDLSASVVSMYDDTVTGIGMLGLRDNRAWITRLGVIPDSRGKKHGTCLMDALLHQASQNNVEAVQLEVITGNEPAYRLFLKYGFQETRELAIVRRPPGLPQFEDPLPKASVSTLTAEEIMECLDSRPGGASWVEETTSIMKTGQLFGYKLDTLDGETGWIVFYSSAFQMEHFVVDATPSLYDEIVLSLLHHVHRRHGIKDTKVENIPVDHPLLGLFQEAGYIESFRRTEMVLMM